MIKFAACVLIWFWFSSVSAATVESVKLEPSVGGLLLSVAVNGGVNPDVFVLKSPSRLVVDIPAGELTASAEGHMQEASGLRGFVLRYARREGFVRLVVDAPEPEYLFIGPSVSSQANGFEIHIPYVFGDSSELSVGEGKLELAASSDSGGVEFVSRWTVRVDDQVLSESLRRWSASMGWTLVWAAARDIPIVSDASFDGAFDEAIEVLLNGLRGGEYPLSAHMNSRDRVITVSRYTQVQK